MNTNLAGSLFVNIYLHMIFVLVLIIGIAFLIIWAAKTLDKKTLKTWAIWLIIIGIIGTLLSCPFGRSGYAGMGRFNMMNSGDGDLKDKIIDDLEIELQEYRGFEAS